MTQGGRFRGIIIDCETGGIDAAAAYWSAVLGTRASGRGSYRKLGRLGMNVEVQKVDHPSRVHIDLAAEDVEAEAARLVGLGATIVARISTWIVLEAPTGHRFCVVRERDEAVNATPKEWPGASGTHRSRIGALCIDCRVDDLTEGAAFWTAALGLKDAPEFDGDGKYASLGGHRGYPKFLLQKVDHDPRVHIDLETDNKDAEFARLVALGTEEVERIKGWIVMQAPTGHRFCIVGPQGDDWPERAGEEADVLS
ncbi:VOC family protein [Pseudoruegeria sp. HB172150]|uniref:VOC family protein n=1 Tax=Pseudoruegeria sp. HB172150 TaxID=2721164 RepID=UPI001C131274|nr:VOC family protein [Pseudoruegeria sp. HB172150]